MKKLSKVANTAQKGSGSKKNSHMLKFESLFVVSKNKIVLILTIKFFFGKIRTLFSFVIEYFYMPIFKGNYSPLTQLFFLIIIFALTSCFLQNSSYGFEGTIQQQYFVFLSKKY